MSETRRESRIPRPEASTPSYARPLAEKVWSRLWADRAWQSVPALLTIPFEWLLGADELGQQRWRGG